MIACPRVKAVQPLDDCRLHVTFENAVSKIYDCTPLLDKPVFAHWQTAGFSGRSKSTKAVTASVGTITSTWPRLSFGFTASQ